jgi:hypothetical protein
MLPVGHEVSW